MEPRIAVHGAEIEGLKAAVDSVKRGVDRIVWWTVGALASLVLACFAVIFKLLVKVP